MSTHTIQPQDSTSRAVEQDARRTAGWPRAIVAYLSVIVYGLMIAVVIVAVGAR